MLVTFVRGAIGLSTTKTVGAAAGVLRTVRLSGRGNWARLARDSGMSAEGLPEQMGDLAKQSPFSHTIANLQDPRLFSTLTVGHF